MRPAHVVYATAQLPERLEPLREIAHNLVWSWNPTIRRAFQDLDPALFESTRRNPVLLLGRVSPERLQAAARDKKYLATLDRAVKCMKEEMERETWFERVNRGRKPAGPIAYFSMEYGIVECLPIYSGGLGMLAGDHLKSASDLGIPLVGVGILFQQGYFSQYLNADGLQGERYPENDFYNLPISPVRGPEGAPYRVAVELPGRQVQAQVWKAQVGRVPLFLLDTNLPDNSREDQDITDQLYGGGKPMRIKQEIVLGVGGIRALEGLGLRPAVCHMNEGHAAFLALERARLAMVQHGFSFEEALEATMNSNVFTTHTPVPAGIDVFDPALVTEHLGPYARTMGFSMEALLSLGRANPGNAAEPFNMARLAFFFSGKRNGVSRLHGKVSRKMWQHLWPEIPVEEIPVGHVTNGVHVGAWVSPEMAALFDEHLTPAWAIDPADAGVWKKAHQIPDETLWGVFNQRRRLLVDFARERLQENLRARGAPKRERDEAATALDPNILTIGFARRFATYKRATLLFRNLDRLARLLNHPERPAQVLFAGKAHPQDMEGKNLIKQIIHVARRPEFRKRIVFIEDYDIRVAKYLVRGVDVWLNNPRRTLEASGTSGMKACANGALHISTLDGWWPEAYHPDLGWAIGGEEDFEDHEYQDQVEADLLMRLLEEQVAPLYYDRDKRGIPVEWLARVKRSIAAIVPFFNTFRMVREYATDYYLPALERYQSMVIDDTSRSRELAAWKKHVRAAWDDVQVREVRGDSHGTVHTGAAVNVEAKVALGRLAPGDVRVELYFGYLDAGGIIRDAAVEEMAHVDHAEDHLRLYRGRFTLHRSGQAGYLIRVRPRHELLHSENELGLIAWEG
ncbi:MAG: alpha-glucan family phosphorylase [Planctomycetes bacterium]|nr:alpha-glucan family phosphorylase [Planctomycetota bacterium]